MLKSIAAGAGTGLLYSTAGCTGGGGGDGGDGGDGGGDGGDGTGGDGGGGDGGDGGGGQTTQTQEGPIKVGGVFPLSGPYSPLGKPQKAGLELTAEVINGEGGILGRELETYIEDSQTEPQAGKQAARKLIESEDVDMVFGPVSSAVAVLVQDYLADKNVIFHAGNAINHMTEEGCEPNTFRWETNNTIFANVGAQWAVENLGENVWVHYADYNWGQEITQDFKDEFDEIGGVNIVGETKSQLGTKDFSTYISQMSASDADWALQNMVGGDAIVFLKQMAEFGLKDQMDVFGANNAFLPVRAASGAASIGTYTPVPYYEGFQSDLNTRIRNLFLEQTERVPDEFQVAIWVGLHATGAAIEEAGSTDRSEVIPALEGLRFQAPVGAEAYYRECDHQGYRPVSVAEITEGEKIPGLDIKAEIPADQAMDPCSEIPCDM